MGCQHAAALLFASFAAVVAVASAAGVTHGDIMLYNYVGIGDAQPVEFRSPKGALKLALDGRKYGFYYTSGAAASADGRYAVVLGQTAAQVWSGSPVAVFIQLGAKTKVLGVRALPGETEKKGFGCSGSYSAAALRSSSGSKGATNLTVYQFMTCCCSTINGKPSGTQFVGQWSVPVSKAGKLGAMRAGPRAPYKISKFDIAAAAIALVSNRVYVSFSLTPIADRDVPPHGVNIYELVTIARKAGAGKRLVASLKFKSFTKVAVAPNWKPVSPHELATGPQRIFRHVPTSATSGFLVSSTLAADKIYYAAKGKRTLSTTIKYGAFTALGSTTYALIYQGTAAAVGLDVYVYKVSAAEMRATAKGRVLFKLPRSHGAASITVVP